MITNENIMKALYRSTLVSELRESEIEILKDLFIVKSYRAGEFIVKPGSRKLEDALLVLVEGRLEVSSMVDDEPMVLHLNQAGDLARVISFVGSNLMKIDANIEVLEDSTVLLLERARLESLLGTHHSIVYYVMRSLVRFAHGLARHKSAETEELSNYFYRLNGRF